MVADEHGLQVGGMLDGAGSVGTNIPVERKFFHNINHSVELINEIS